MENEQFDVVDEFEVNLDSTAAEEVVEVPVAIPEQFDVNLAEFIDEETLSRIGQERQEVLQNFKEARQEHDAFLVEHIKLLGIGPRENTSPIPGGCDALHPILMESIVKFQAKAIQELWPAKGPVRTEVVGLVNEQRLQAAARVKAHMNYQLSREVPGAYSDRERGLFRLAALGTNIMKVGWSEQRATLDPVIVPMERFFVDPAVTHLRYADEYIEVADYSARRMQALVSRGYFREVNDTEDAIQLSEIEEALNKAQGIDQPGIRTGYVVGEAHCYLDLDGLDPLVPAGEAAPYIVHFNVNSGKVYSIRRNWAPGDLMRNRLMWYVAESMIPGFGFYGYGYIHLIGDIAKGATTTLRALVDAGMFANFQGGFKSRLAKFSQSDAPIEFGEWRDVDAAPEDLQKSFFPLPFKEPSQVLFQLLQFMVGAGQKFADSTDQVVSEASNYGPVATTLALLEASQRFYSSIHKRLHKSQEEFFALLARVNFMNLPDKVNFVVNSENQFVLRTDYDPAVVAVLPASDPNALTETQRVAKAQIILETAQRFPQHVDARQALRHFYLSMGVDNLDMLMPDPETQAVSADPLTELQVAMRGRPIRAQIGQNHAAHIIVKEAFLKAPQMQGTNDPTVAVGMEIIKANIAEHKVLMFISQVLAQAQQVGVNPQDEMVQAQIAQQLMMMSAENGASAGGGDSVEQAMLQLQAQELAIADKRIESQNARDIAAMAIKARELALKEQMFLLEAAEKLERRKLDAAAKILDTHAKMADIETKRLSALTQQQLGGKT